MARVRWTAVAFVTHLPGGGVIETPGVSSDRQVARHRDRVRAALLAQRVTARSLSRQ